MSEEKDTGMRILWELCSDFKLGAGGCPDGLIRQYVKSLESRLKEAEKQNTTLHSINNEWEKDYVILESKLSTLLKASEGLEKALEPFPNHPVKCIMGVDDDWSYCPRCGRKL